MSWCTRRSTPSASRRSERGAVLVLTALAMLIVLLIAAFATDLGAWYSQGRDQQRAADIAALNGVQSYSGNVRAELDALGAASLAELSTADHVALETSAFQDAVADVIGTLGLGGLNIVDVPVYTIAPRPGISTATVTAVSGATITITRDPDGRIKTAISEPGDQYFSNLVRDAPTIVREATAAVSNCGADCTTSVEFVPPSTGFDASGTGDGYKPLVADNGRVYAVNHHAIPGFGSVVCMVIETELDCPGFPLQLNHYTSSRAEDAYDDARDRVYFAAVVETTDPAGIVSYDFGVECVSGGGTYCGFTPLEAAAAVSGGQGALPGVGVWLVNDQIFALGQDGSMHCVEPANIGTASPMCAGYPKNSAIATDPLVRGAMEDWAGGAGAVWNGQIYISQALTGWNGGYHCWDPGTASVCANFPGVDGGAPSNLPSMRFLRYDNAGTIIGFCTGTNQPSVMHTCVDSSGTRTTNPIPDLNMAGGSTYGNGSTFEGRYMYYSNGPDALGTYLNCYDWQLAQSCSTTNPNVPPIYGTEVLDDTCMISLGHTSKFYTWEAVTRLPCGGDPAVTNLWPCICADGTARYGDLTVPQEVAAFLASVDATVTGGGQTVGPVDILNNPLDLSSFDGVPGPLTLTLDVTSAVDENGTLLWTQPLEIDVTMAVQPTLVEN